jgi:hypothetical protein
VILITMALAIIFMGIASPLFTRRMESSTNNLLQQMNRPQAPVDASKASPTPPRTVILPGMQKNPTLTTISARQVRP